jgi:hypothetical protein
MFITHDIAAASYVCHNIAVMKGGRIVERGPKKDHRGLRAPVYQVAAGGGAGRAFSHLSCRLMAEWYRRRLRWQEVPIKRLFHTNYPYDFRATCAKHNPRSRWMTGVLVRYKRMKNGFVLSSVACSGAARPGVGGRAALFLRRRRDTTGSGAQTGTIFVETRTLQGCMPFLLLTDQEGAPPSSVLSSVYCRIES